MRRLVIDALAAGTCLFALSAAFAQTPPTEDAADVAMQPEAVQALDKMAAHLRTLQQFRLTATTTADDVLEDGQVVETAGRAVYDVRTPDRFRVLVSSDKQERAYFYDGSTVTQFAPALGHYSIFDAGPTIAETIDLAIERYGVELPLADLFYWGTERSTAGAIKSAFFVTEARVAGETCNHYAYRAEVTDFQVWIRKHGDPLPCRLVIVTTDDPARPRYSATLEWNVDALIGDTNFAFVPPPGATKIEQSPAIESGN